nr:hypothetical protein [Gammaproteobacteria bacterium]
QGDGTAPHPLRAQMIDPYLPFVLKTLEEYPTLRATRLYEMVRERGFAGSQSHFRRVVRRHRPARRTEAYLRLRMLPGECAQCDWGSFGHLMIGRARRQLSGFVMVLAHSRDIYLRFFLEMRMENFQRGHLGAFARWGECPRIVLYDNLLFLLCHKLSLWFRETHQGQRSSSWTMARARRKRKVAMESGT